MSSSAIAMDGMGRWPYDMVGLYTTCHNRQRRSLGCAVLPAAVYNFAMRCMYVYEQTFNGSVLYTASMHGYL